MKKQNDNSLWQRVIPLLMIAVIPLLSVAGYTQFYSSSTELESNSTASAYHLEPIIPPSEAENKQVPSVEELTSKLAARLNASPEDPRGWILLAKSYEHIHNIEKAREAYDKAKHYGASDAELEKRLTSNSGSSE